MVKELLMAHSSEIGLVLFFLCFVAVAWWAATRSRKELDGWSSLPLAGGGELDETNQSERRA